MLLSGLFGAKASKKQQLCPKDQSFHKFTNETQQYSDRSIRRYERIFGNGYISAGGQDTTKEFVAKLKLKEGDKVLDLGCGIGGAAFYMAQAYGVEVIGIDSSPNLHRIAKERAKQHDGIAVKFELCDATKKEFPEESFDIIYSRETILHIRDKNYLFTKLLRWLKPGGKLFIADYCSGDKEPSDEFAAFIAKHGYHLLSPQQYGNLLVQVGFVNVIADDRTLAFQEILQRELEHAVQSKDAFIAETSTRDYQHIIYTWKAKIERCGKGEQRWGVFLASKSRH